MSGVYAARLDYPTLAVLVSRPGRPHADSPQGYPDLEVRWRSTPADHLRDCGAGSAGPLLSLLSLWTYSRTHPASVERVNMDG